MSKPVNVWDMPAGQVEAIEERQGMRFSDWFDDGGGVKTLSGLFADIYATATGEDIETVKATMTMGELSELVSIGKPDPQTPSET